MKYFLIKTDPIYTTAPDVRNWNSKIEKKYIDKELHYKIENRILLTIEPNNNTVFTDILMTPSFMVTDKLKNVINLYMPKTDFKEVVLLDQKNGLVQVYNMPILPKLDCLSAESELMPNHIGVKKIVLDLEKIADYTLFKIEGVLSDYFIIRLDMAESFLRREAKGIFLTDLECIKEGAINI